MTARETVRVHVIYSGDEASLRRANDAGFPDTLLKGAIADDLIELVDG